jgi:hypothetical protein
LIASQIGSGESRAFDAMLSACLPGVGQLNQGRIATGIHFLLNAGLLAVVLTGVPPLAVPAMLGLAGVTGWAVIDAWRGRPGRAQ